MKKRIISLLMIGVLVFGMTAMAGCDKEKPAPTAEASAVVSAEPTAEPSAEVTAEPTAEPTEAPIVYQIKEPVELPAINVMEDMRVGWNLGNTLDATNGSMLDLTYETSWQNTRTSQELVDTIKAAGFNTIRIPITWSKHCGGDNFVISQKWMDRVQEIVDYAINDDMYVIINMHHDIDAEHYYPDEAHLESSTHYVECIWMQICERFIDYDEHLIFESVNEPRLNADSSLEWSSDFSKSKLQEAQKCINELNQVFVNTVRTSGGNNASRYLMTPGYCASPEGALNKYFELATDPTDHQDRIMVSVHAYTPYLFALADNKQSDFSKATYTDIDTFMKKLNTKFVQEGVTVVIGEFGARDKGGNTEDRAEYAEYYVKTAQKYGMICCWWDNNAFTGSGELFGVLHRADLTFTYPEIFEAMMRALEE